jgi:hypothetical protein
LLQGKAADDWSSKCIDMVYKANEFKAKVVNCEFKEVQQKQNSKGNTQPKSPWVHSLQAASTVVHGLFSAQHNRVIYAALLSAHPPCFDFLAVMVTMYWVDANYDGKVDKYCHKIRWGEGEVDVL